MGSVLEAFPNEVIDLLHKETHVVDWTQVQKDKAEIVSRAVRQRYIDNDVWDIKLADAEKNNKATVVVLESSRYYAVIWLYAVDEKYITNLHYFVNCLSKDSKTTLFCGESSYIWPIANKEAEKAERQGGRSESADKNPRKVENERGRPGVVVPHSANENTRYNTLD